jgi:hypothetical protein
MAFRALSLFAVAAVAEKIADWENGAKFEKCLKITDLETKTLDDDITLYDRDEGGCCPEGTVPGVKHTNLYQGPQIICGFKDDGSLSMSTGSSNGVKTCTYNQCFVWKQGVECADGSQRLNGCCAEADDCSGNACGFKETCKNYAKYFNNVYSERTNYCTIYHKDYSSLGYAGTSQKTDDIADGSLVIDKLYTFTQCAGDAGSSGGSSDVNSAAQFSVSAVIALLCLKLM